VIGATVASHNADINAIAVLLNMLDSPVANHVMRRLTRRMAAALQSLPLGPMAGHHASQLSIKKQYI
jgi:hypothetical protein